jgi:hypothetical protein
MPTRRPIVLASAVFATLVAVPAMAATVTSVFDGKVPCLPLPNGVQFCAGSLLTRVETWDGVPLDANVSIPPASMTGPFPLIVDLHGWGIGKSPTPDDGALDGYVVLSYSARGFHFSCGFAAARLPDLTLSNPTACTDRGWIRLADARYEGRDTQYLAGRLADEGLVIPNKVGVTGSSYGGGQSMILAALKNRVMLPDGSLIPWKSPGGLDMAIAAAAPLIPWSDLAYALVPTGHTLDYLIENPYGVHAGIEKQSWVTALYALGLTTGFYAPAGADPDADITAWRNRIEAGEPYDDDPMMQHVVSEVTAHHSAYYVDDSIPPAPLFMYNAFTDDLFPADESLRFWRKTRAKHPTAEIALQYADHFGHPRASLAGDMATASARVAQLFARHLKGTADPAPPPLETYTQTCGGSTETGRLDGDGAARGRRLGRDPSRRGPPERRGREGVRLRWRQLAHLAGGRPVDRWAHVVPDAPDVGRRHERGDVPAARCDGRRVDAHGLADGDRERRGERHVPRDRAAALGRRAERLAVARRAGPLPAARGRREPAGLPAPRERLALRRRPRREARARRQEHAVRPGVERLVHDHDHGPRAAPADARAAGRRRDPAAAAAGAAAGQRAAGVRDGAPHGLPHARRGAQGIDQAHGRERAEAHVEVDPRRGDDDRRLRRPDEHDELGVLCLRRRTAPHDGGGAGRRHVRGEAVLDHALEGLPLRRPALCDRRHRTTRPAGRGGRTCEGRHQGQGGPARRTVVARDDPPADRAAPEQQRRVLEQHVLDDASERRGAVEGQFRLAWDRS